MSIIQETIGRLEELLQGINDSTSILQETANDVFGPISKESNTVTKNNEVSFEANAVRLTNIIDKCFEANIRNYKEAERLQAI